MQYGVKLIVALHTQHVTIFFFSPIRASYNAHLILLEIN
jgi:hypothetical protein